MSENRLDLLKALNCFISISQLSRDNAMKQIYFVETATHQIQSQLLPDAAQDENFCAVYNACGALAFYKYTLCCAASDDENEFRAGDIMVKRNAASKAEYAKQLCDEAIAAISSLLKDNTFVFSVIG